MMEAYCKRINRNCETPESTCLDCMLDKIRAEIEELDRYYDNDYFSGNKDPMFKCNEVLLIIDKYRGITND